MMYGTSRVLIRQNRWYLTSQARWATFPGGRSYDGLWANTSFEHLGVHPALVNSLEAQDIVRPTVVQAEAFQPIVRGRDVILRAETGSGKTLAYLLPLVNRIYHLHERAKKAAEDPEAPNPLQRTRPWVVLTPTSDLAAQVLAMLEAIDGNRLVNAQSLSHLFRWEATRRIGQLTLQEGFQSPKPKERTVLPSKLSATSEGATTSYASLAPQIRWGSTDIVVTTPLKFCEDLEHFKEDRFYPACVIMDEADALFQGLTRVYLFEIFKTLRPRLKIRQLDEEREPLPEMIPTQFIFAAATYVHVGPFSEGNMLIERFGTAQVVETKYFHGLPSGIGVDNVRWLNGSDDWHQRVEELVDVLRRTPCQRTLIFVNSVHNCHVLLQFFKENGWPVVSFMKGPRGRMGPRFRDAQKFADGEANIMIATEFGGRGIDWHEVDHVVNFQMPMGAVNWLHRVGRTGRMGKRGLVTNFVGSKDKTLAELIQGQLLAGKDLHTLFSRRRSLRRRLRQEQKTGSGDSGESPQGMDGGLELFHDSDMNEDGQLIGYLNTPKLEQQAKGRPPKETTEAADVQADDNLSQIRARLLESDSESEDDAPNSEESGDEGDEMPGVVSSPEAGFSWSQLDDRTQGEAVAPKPSRPLERGSSKNPTQVPRRGYTDQDRLSAESRVPRGRKAVGVRTKNRLDAGRNYSAPDDELLM